MYGKMICLDIHECDSKKMTKPMIRQYFKEVCDLIGMERVKAHWWTDEGISKEEWEANPHLQGVSAVQFIKTSAITLHAITGLGNVYVDIFSCNDFDTRLAEGFTIKFFDGTKKSCVVMDRE